MMVWGLGRPVVDAVVVGLTRTPRVLLSSHVSGSVGSRWSRPAARRVVLGLLVVLALSTLLAAPLTR